MTPRRAVVCATRVTLRDWDRYAASNLGSPGPSSLTSSGILAGTSSSSSLGPILMQYTLFPDPANRTPGPAVATHVAGDGSAMHAACARQGPHGFLLSSLSTSRKMNNRPSGSGGPCCLRLYVTGSWLVPTAMIPPITPLGGWHDARAVTRKRGLGRASRT